MRIFFSLCFSYLHREIIFVRAKFPLKRDMAFSALLLPDQRSSILNFVNRRCNNANAVAQPPSNVEFIPFYTWQPRNKRDFY